LFSYTLPRTAVTEIDSSLHTPYMPPRMGILDVKLSLL